MLSHFLNVSFPLPQALELDKGQDYWWLHVIFPYFILSTAQQAEGDQGGRKVHSQPVTIPMSSFSKAG